MRAFTPAHKQKKTMSKTMCKCIKIIESNWYEMQDDFCDYDSSMFNYKF